VINGTTVPPRWETTETVLLALASLAKHEPDEYVRMLGWRLPLTELTERLWNRALDDPTGTRDPAESYSCSLSISSVCWGSRAWWRSGDHDHAGGRGAALDPQRVGGRVRRRAGRA
jgi:hypothetical protein